MLKPLTNPVSLLPKEHGAYAMLLIPLATAMLTVGWTPVGGCVAIAAVAGFLAHEPLLVTCGHRGQRARACTPQAPRRLIEWGLIALIAGAVAFWLGNVLVRQTLGIFFVFALISFSLSIAGYHRRMAAHLWGMFGLSLPCVPILLAGDISLSQTFSFWCVWILGFAATTLAVRGMMAKQKRQSRWVHLSGLTILTIAIGIGAAWGCRWSLVTLPMFVVSWCLLANPPPLKQIKRVGWAMVAGVTLTAMMAIGVMQ